MPPCWQKKSSRTASQKNVRLQAVQKCVCSFMIQCRIKSFEAVSPMWFEKKSESSHSFHLNDGFSFILNQPLIPIFPKSISIILNPSNLAKWKNISPLPRFHCVAGDFHSLARYLFGGNRSLTKLPTLLPKHRSKSSGEPQIRI